jgi:hypothetical protein
MLRRAFGLPAVLVLASFLVLLGFTLVQMSTGQLHANSQMDVTMQADCLAESAANLALANIMTNPQFGAAGSAGPKSVKLSLPGTQGIGRATFDTNQASQWNMPPSLNNLAGTAAAPGYQRSIPAQTVQIIAEGRVGTTLRRLEAVISRPPFPYALASSGSIYSSGGLLVEGVKDINALTQGVGSIPPAMLTPGFVAANAGGAQGMQLLSSASLPTLVTGDARSCGAIVLGPDTTIKGAVKAQSDAIALPAINITTYDPQGLQGLSVISQGTYSTQLAATGLLRRSGDLTLTQGINLNSAYLYVDGNLQISGGLTGRGAIFVTGNLNIQGTSNFSADNTQALLAQGSMTLNGNGKDSSFFSGLLYTQGDFNAADITLVGTAIADRVGVGGGSNVNIQRSNLLSNPQALSFSFLFPGLTPQIMPPTMIGGGGGEEYVASVTRDPNLNYSAFYDAQTDSFNPALVTAQSAGLQFILLKTTTNQSWTLNSSQAVVDTLVSIGAQTTMPLSQVGTTMDNYQKNKLSSLKSGQISLDPNQFLQLGDQLRKVLWRHIQ